MRIGVTYDLRADYLAMGYGEEDTAEFDSEITIAAICEALGGLRHERIGPSQAQVDRPPGCIREADGQFAGRGTGRHVGEDGAFGL